MRARRGLVAAIGVAACATARAAEPDPFRVVARDVRLEIGDLSLAPLAWRQDGSELAAGDLLLEFDRNRIVAREAGTRKDRWTALLPAGRRIQVRATGPGVLVATLWTSRWRGSSLEKGEAYWAPEEPGVLRRLSLADGAWLPSWAIGEGGVARVLADDEGAVALTLNGRTASVRAFDWSGGAPRWSHAFEAEESSPRWFRGPIPTHDHDVGDARLQAARDDVLVACGDGANLLAIDRKTGELEWRVDRVWEFDRRSVELQNRVWEVSRARTASEREDLRRRSTVAAGPVVVAHEDRYRVFVAVDRARLEGTVEPVPESRTYEIDSWGGVMSVTPLPRPASVGVATASPAGVLWSLEGGLLLQMPSAQEPGGWRGLGATDMQGAIAWYRAFPTAVPDDAWLRTEGYGSPGTALAADGARVVVAGGAPYVRARGESAFRIPLRRIDPATGVEQPPAMTLVLPFAGPFPSLEGTSRAGTIETAIETYGSFGMSLYGLALRGDRLVAYVASRDHLTTVEFPWDASK
jgi:hypothetical protein